MGTVAEDGERGRVGMTSPATVKESSDPVSSLYQARTFATC